MLLWRKDMMRNNNTIRPCGSSFAYCDGNCVGCTENEYETSNSTTITTQSTSYKTSTEDDSISKPTKEQYEKSIEAKKNLSEWIRLSRKRQGQLIDDLCKERSLEKDYQGMYEAHKDIIRKYEIYEEIEASNGKM